MNASRNMLTWCIRVVLREDPALRRISSLKAYRNDAAKSRIPVFFAHKTSAT
ncbi:MAG: hypothetical protein J0L76_13965 [Rhodobacterales bacterium]|nr:hypothetical protein [Rhodobacterales bacterium]